MYHYVYRITNTDINKHYYGSRTSKLHPKEDLGLYYFSSSTDKEFIKEQKSNPHIFKYKVVKICVTRDKATSMEISLHKRFNVGNNPNFYNIVIQSSSFFIPSESTTIKSIKTRATKVEDNGLTIMMNNGRKAYHTRKTTMIEGVSIQELSTRKTITTKYLQDENGLTIHKKSAIKAKKTMVDNDLYKVVAYKGKITKMNTIDVNGYNTYQNATKMAVITKKTTFENNGRTIQENSTSKTLQTKREKGLFEEIIKKCNDTKKSRLDENGISDFDKQYIKMSNTKYEKAIKYDVYDKYNNIIKKGLTKKMISDEYSRSLIKTSYDKRLGSTPSARALLIKNNKEHIIGMYVKEQNVSNY